MARSSSSAYRLYDSGPAGENRRTDKQLTRTNTRKKTSSQENKALQLPAKEEAKSRKGSMRLIRNVLLLCLMALAILFRYSTIVERDHKVAGLKKEYTTISDENKRLQVEIDSALNLNNVEQIAMQELGMAKPEKYQTVYVDIKGSDYVEMAAEETEDTANGKQFYATIIQTLGNVLEYLY